MVIEQRRPYDHKEATCDVNGDATIDFKIKYEKEKRDLVGVDIVLNDSSGNNTVGHVQASLVNSSGVHCISFIHTSLWGYSGESWIGRFPLEWGDTIRITVQKATSTDVVIGKIHMERFP